MKSYLLSLSFVALAAAARAQTPVDVTVMPQAGGVVAVGTATAATAVTAAAAPSAVGNLLHCEGGKCSKRDTVCVPVPATITKTKVLFSSDCEVKCHKGIFNFLSRGGDCGSCPDGKCGHAHVERYLYKRVQTETCDSYKCVPTPRGLECANGQCVSGHTAASQPIPANATGVAPIWFKETDSRR